MTEKYSDINSADANILNSNHTFVEPASLDGNNLSNDSSVNFPEVDERLAKLRPSRQLLEFYRKKMTDYDGEFETLLGKLEEYRSSFDTQCKERWEIRKREEEILELQKALSDVQLYLFQERDHVLRLYAENDRLKIKELEDRKAIQHLLTLQPSQQTNQPETTYFFKDTNGIHSNAVVESNYKIVNNHLSLNNKPHRNSSTRSQIAKPATSPHLTKYKNSLHCIPIPEEVEIESLKLTCESLRAQLAEQSKLAKEQVEILLEDRRVKEEECQLRADRDIEKINTLKDKQKKCQDLLYQSTRDYLQLKYEVRVKERAWMSEKDSLLQRLDKVTSHLEEITGADENKDYSFVSNFPEESTRRDEIHIRNQLEQSQQLVDNYREQLIKSEEGMARLREENEVSKHLFEQRTEKLTKRLQLLNQRYQDLEKRRSLEIEGYRNDIKLLRNTMKDLEQHLYKISLNISGDQDIAILGVVRQTACSAKKLLGDLHGVKNKVFQLEKELRYVHH